MNSKKLGMFAAAALTVSAAQAFAGDPPAGAKGKEVKDGVCINQSCSTANSQCKGKAYFDDIKDMKACEGHGKWGSKTDGMKPIKTADKK